MPHSAFPEPYAQAVDILERAVRRFTIKMRPPLFLPEESRPRYRYPDPSPELLRSLKAVRVVSALNAAAPLLAEGFVIEVCVLLRTIDDFLTEMNFAVPDESGELGPKQQRFIDEFFAEDMPTQAEMRETRKRPGRVAKKHMQANEARWLSQVTGDPHTISTVSRNVNDMFSGCVHGSYISVMEMYNGERFPLSGLSPAGSSRGYAEQLAFYVHRSLNTFMRLAYDLELGDLVTELYDGRKRFESSGAYPAIADEPPE